MRVRSLLKSIGVRFALFHTLGFIVSVSIIGWVAEVSVTTALEHQARGRVEIEVASLMADYQRLGLAGLRASIEARSPANKHLEYAIAGSDGAIIFGDHSLSKFVARPNAGTSLITRYGGGLASDTILVARQGLGSEMQLLVADDLQSVDDVEDVVEGGSVYRCDQSDSTREFWDGTFSFFGEESFSVEFLF